MNKKLDGYRFTRQKPILDYIVDFYSDELALVVEIDGDSHDEKKIYDKKRDEEIAKI